MTKIFADTSYWVALASPADQIHEQAVRVTQRLSPAYLVTTEMVLTELLNAFSNTPLRSGVGGMVARLRQEQNLKIVPQTAAQFESALRRYRLAADKSWSLTDCASFDVMETENIRQALTHDRHFVQAGFDALLR